MKKIILILPIVVLMACSDLTELNKNKKDPVSVPGSTLFTNGQKKLVDQVVETNVNRNVFRLIMQYWTQTTYTDESNYNLETRTVPDNHWINLYRDALKNLNEAHKVTKEMDFKAIGGDPVKKNQLATIEIMTVYAYSVLVDTFGDVPYTEALDDKNLLPKYDDGLTIYKDLLKRLNAATADMNAGAGGFPSQSDNIYQGDVTSWLKFANSLKLRMGITISDVDNALAKKTVEEATAAGVISSSSENANMDYLTSPPNTNPVYVALVLSGRSDYVAANTIVEAMNTHTDPRREYYFTDKEGEYQGGVIGSTNSYALYSHVNPNISKADAKGVLMTYSEVEFLLAEAVERGYNVGGAAQEHYDNAVKASIKYWGGSDDSAGAYLAQSTVAYSTASGTWKEKIGVQSWLALYNRGYEAWNSWRRLDAPALVQPTQTDRKTPVRFKYPTEEQTLNGANNKAASARLNGGDDYSSKLFWDVN